VNDCEDAGQLVAFNTVTNISHALRNIPCLPNYKCYHYALAMTWTNSGLLVCGDLNTCEMYNASFGTWSNVSSPFAAGVMDFPMTVLSGRPYIFGGQYNGLAVNNVYIYSANATWGNCAPIPTPLRGVGVVALADSNTVYIEHS
jgi:hypothetical protein